MDGLYTPACKSSAGSRPPKPSGYAHVSSLEPPSSATAGNGFSALRGSRVSSTSATLPAPIAPPPDTPPSAGQIPCSPMSKTASWPPTAPSRPNICRATSAPSPGASTAASSSKQFTSDWPSLPRRPRQCPIAFSNWLRLDGKREGDFHMNSRRGLGDRLIAALLQLDGRAADLLAVAGCGEVQRCYVAVGLRDGSR